MPAVLDCIASRSLEMKWGRDGSIWRGEVLRPMKFQPQHYLEQMSECGKSFQKKYS
jgi:hypothetical protein